MEIVTPSRILIIQGHPDSSATHFCHALAQAYREAAAQAGHAVKEIAVAKLEFPLLRTKQEFENSAPPEPIRDAQDLILWAQHIVIIYPLWLGCMPALLKGFLEQTLRPQFTAIKPHAGSPGKKRLIGKTARIVVTMGMPAFFYRWYFRAHGLKNLQRNILSFCGIKPLGATLIGMIEGRDDAYRQTWLRKMAALGAKSG
jgi:putative NADPH-quinone reductase